MFHMTFIATGLEWFWLLAEKKKDLRDELSGQDISSFSHQDQAHSVLDVRECVLLKKYNVNV